MKTSRRRNVFVKLRCDLTTKGSAHKRKFLLHWSTDRKLFRTGEDADNSNEHVNLNF
jgi:hypothetical protein